MTFRLLVAAADPGYLASLREVAEKTCGLLPMALEVEECTSLDEARERLAVRPPDAVMLDWNLLPSGPLRALADVVAAHPELRLLVLLPEPGREYREAVWGAGACACVPRDRIDPEWLQAILCVMNRARQREARLRERAA